MPVRTEVLMGTIVTIHAVSPGADEAIERAFGWFREVEARCSRFDEHSELRQLTARVGIPVRASAILFEAVRFARAVAADTDGAFDPAIGHRMEARGFNHEDRTGRTVRTPIGAADVANYRDLCLDPESRTITLRRPLLLDLGAVAKGLAVDAAARELRACRDFAIDAGGDLYLGGRNQQGDAWSIGIRHPRLDRTLIDALRVTDTAVCTSGDYERPMHDGHLGRSEPAVVPPGSGDSVDPGVMPVGASAGSVFGPKEHHILDPRTGKSPAALASATVVASSAMLADALATAAFVLGPADGLALLARHGVEGLLVTPALERVETPGFAALRS